MPVMNGLEAAKIILRTVKYFPIMALTGNLRAKDEYSAAGMDDFLEKPYSFENLNSKINNLTIKIEKIYVTDGKLKIAKEIPMDREELQELMELKKKGLTKLKLVGTGATFIVHKNVQNKISHDIVGEEKSYSNASIVPKVNRADVIFTKQIFMQQRHFYSGGVGKCHPDRRSNS